MTDSLPGDTVANQPASEQQGANPLVGQPTESEATSEQPTAEQPLAGAEGAPRADVTAEDQVPEWLKELSDSSVGEAMEASTAKPFIEAVSREKTPAPDAELAIVEPSAPAHDELPDWLREEAQVQDRQTEIAPSKINAPSQTETFPEELPQWLSQPYPAAPGGEKAAVPLEATETGAVVPGAGTGKRPLTAASKVEGITPALNTEGTTPALEARDLQVPDILSSESQAAQPEEAEAVGAKETERGNEGTIESAGLSPSAEHEPAPEPIETGEMPDWMHELAHPASPALPGKAKSLRGEPPQLAEDERGELPDWLREAVPGQGGAEPTIAAPGTEALTPTPPSEMPGWVEELRTRAARTVPGEPLAEPAETEGALAGVHGILPIAFSIAQPHTVSAAAASHDDSGRVFESVLMATAEGVLAPPAAVAKPARRSWANRWIYLAVFLAALIPLFIPSDSAGLGLKVNNTTPTARFYDKVHSLPSGSTVLLAFDYDAGQAVELNTAARVIVQDLARRQVNVVALSTSPAGAQIAQAILLEATQQNPSWRRGDNFVNVGYIPGDEAGLRALADRWLPQNQIDFENESLASSPLANKLGGLPDFALAIEFAGGDASLRWWMEQVQPRQQLAFVAAVSAAAEPQARNYLAANQLAAFLRGLGGAAEYELFSNQIGLTVRTVDAQSFSQILIAAIIVLGNLVFLFGRLRRSETSRS